MDIDSHTWVVVTCFHGNGPTHQRFGGHRNAETHLQTRKGPCTSAPCGVYVLGQKPESMKYVSGRMQGSDEQIPVCRLAGRLGCGAANFEVGFVGFDVDGAVAL